MIKRTTIEIDAELLDRAKKALGETSTRGTVETALRRAAEGAEAVQAWRAERQRTYVETLSARADLDVLASHKMWR